MKLEVSNKGDLYCGYYKSPLGFMEILSKEDFIFSVSFIENINKKELLNDCIRKTILQLEEYFCGKRKKFDLNLFLQGTEFQKKVWLEINKIPYAKTETYQQIAIRIDNFKAVRAVGNAVGKNKLLIIIPCHRVLGKNNNLFKYSSGSYRKKWLLEFEKRY